MGDKTFGLGTIKYLEILCHTTSCKQQFGKLLTLPIGNRCAS